MVNQAISHSEHTLTINNFEMYYQVYGTSAPLLLLHGFTGCGVDLLPVFEPLLKHTNSLLLI